VSEFAEDCTNGGAIVQSRIPRIWNSRKQVEQGKESREEAGNVGMCAWSVECGAGILDFF